MHDIVRNGWYNNSDQCKLDVSLSRAIKSLKFSKSVIELIRKELEGATLNARSIQMS